MDETRDVDLGRQLETLTEPDHGPEYWRDVRLLVAETSAEARRPGLARRLRAAFSHRSLRLAVAAAAVAVVAAAVLLAGLPRTQGPQSVSATEVLDRALAAYSSGHTWRADLLVKAYASDMWEPRARYDTFLIRFLRDADGSYRYTWYAGTSARSRITSVDRYDAKTGVVSVHETGKPWSVTTRVPFGPPDTWSSPLTGVDLGATLRAVAASRTLNLGEAVVDGRSVWMVTCTKGEMAGLPRTNVDWPVYTIAVEKDTWLPVRYQIVRAGILGIDVRMRDVRVDEPIPRRAFGTRPAPGATVRRSDRGFRRVTLDEARTSPGVTVLVPGTLPKGYRLATVAVAPRSLTFNRVIRSRDVFALLYTSGFDKLTVTTRRYDQYYTAADDPFEEGYDPAWSRLTRTERTIGSGAFAGARAKIVVATDTSTPHLWAVNDGVLLTISGGATAEELLAVAESLQIYPDASPTASSSPAQ